MRERQNLTRPEHSKHPKLYESQYIALIANSDTKSLKKKGSEISEASVDRQLGTNSDIGITLELLNCCK